MNKGDLVDQVAVAANVTKKDADAVVSAMLEAIVEAVGVEEKVTLVRFGSLSHASAKLELGEIRRQVRRWRLRKVLCLRSLLVSCLRIKWQPQVKRHFLENTPSPAIAITRS